MRPWDLLRPLRPGLAVLALLGVHDRLMAAESPPAGARELQLLDAQIALVRTQLDGVHDQIAASQQLATATLVQHLHDFIDSYHDLPAAPAPSLDTFQDWYLRLLRERRGFDPLAPMPAWQRTWSDLVRNQDALTAADEALRVALHRLERLRARLRRQLSRSEP